MTARTRRGTRTRSTLRPARRGSRTRLTFIDRFMLAGIAGGLVYLLLLHVVSVPVMFASAFGLIMFGFALGALVTVRRWPRLRSPIAWRPRR
ncbi:hypothetical protein [Actinomadura sp. SCN-SB]|uniref:hypothetical protein n=1 Tax=Actinomadura sp. SCN-SB TaxID=3373092 RepID=UPI003751DD19